MPRIDGHFTLPEVSHKTDLSHGTLYWYRHMDVGPPCYKIGKSILYPIAEFEQWWDARAAATLRGSIGPGRPLKPAPASPVSLNPLSA
jgi:predicted DNA-binding transcriptional regulator AlpA